MLMRTLQPKGAKACGSPGKGGRDAGGGGGDPDRHWPVVTPLALLEQGWGKCGCAEDPSFFGPQVETSVECVKNGGQAFTLKIPYHGVCAHDINAYESVGT